MARVTVKGIDRDNLIVLSTPNENIAAIYENSSIEFKDITLIKGDIKKCNVKITRTGQVFMV